MYRLQALLVLYLAVGTQALTYWVSPECADAGAGFDEKVMDEVRAMGKEGSARLKDDGNENTAYNFKTIFKVEKSDEGARTKALNALETIAAATLTDNLEASDVRIYCDDDAADDDNDRWIPAPPKANKKKPFQDRQYWDKINRIYRRIGSKGCQDENVKGEKYTLAQTYKRKGDPDKAADTHNPDRETITICDEGLEFGEGDGRYEKLLAEFTQDDKEMVLIPFLDFDALLSVTVFHEFCHLTKVIDAPGRRPGDEQELQGWKEITAAPAEEVIDSADAFAWFGLLGLMETRNLRLARPDAEDPVEKKRAEDGGLVYVDPAKGPESLTKRSLRKSGASGIPWTDLRIRGKRVVKFTG